IEGYGRNKGVVLPRRGGQSYQVTDSESDIRHQASIKTSCHHVKRLSCPTEVRTVKDRYLTGIDVVIAHAGETIDDDFGVIDPGRCRLNECERGGCDHPMSGLHDRPPFEVRKPPSGQTIIPFRRRREPARDGMAPPPPARGGPSNTARSPIPDFPESG